MPRLDGNQYVLANPVIKLTATSADLQRELRQAGGTLSRELDSMGSRIQRFGDRIGSLGVKFSLLSAPIVAIGVKGIKAAQDFDSALAEISARTGTVGTELEMVSELAQQMGRDTVFSAQDAVKAMLELTTSGQSVTEAMATLPEVLNLAAAGGLNLGTSADAVTDIMKQFKLEIEDTTIVSNALTQAASISSASVSDLVAGFQNVGGRASAFGLTVEQTAAALATLAENGIKGSEAGTALRSMLVNMTRPTQEVEAAWARLGTSMFNADGSARDLSDVMQDVRAGLDEMTDIERTETLQRLFGTYGSGAALALTYSDALNEVVADMTGQSDAATVATARMDTFEGSINSLQGSIEGLMIRVFRPFMNDVLKPLVDDHLIPITNAITEWVGENESLVANILKIGGALVLVGPSLFVLGGAIQFVGFSMGAVLSPLALVAAGFGALIAYGTDFMGFKEVVANALNVLADALRNVANFTSDIPFIGQVVSGGLDFLSEGLQFAAESIPKRIADEIKETVGATTDAINTELETAIQIDLSGLSALETRIKEANFGGELGDVLQLIPDSLRETADAGTISQEIADNIIEQTGAVMDLLDTDAISSQMAGQMIDALIAIGDSLQPDETGAISGEGSIAAAGVRMIEMIGAGLENLQISEYPATWLSALIADLSVGAGEATVDPVKVQSIATSIQNKIDNSGISGKLLDALNTIPASISTAVEGGNITADTAHEIDAFVQAILQGIEDGNISHTLGTNLILTLSQGITDANVHDNVLIQVNRIPPEFARGLADAELATNVNTAIETEFGAINAANLIVEQVKSWFSDESAPTDSEWREAQRWAESTIESLIQTTANVFRELPMFIYRSFQSAFVDRTVPNDIVAMVGEPTGGETGGFWGGFTSLIHNVRTGIVDLFTLMLDNLFLGIQDVFNESETLSELQPIITWARENIDSIVTLIGSTAAIVFGGPVGTVFGTISLGKMAADAINLDLDSVGDHLDISGISSAFGGFFNAIRNTIGEIASGAFGGGQVAEGFIGFTEFGAGEAQAFTPLQRIGRSLRTGLDDIGSALSGAKTDLFTSTLPTIVDGLKGAWDALQGIDFGPIISLVFVPIFDFFSSTLSNVITIGSDVFDVAATIFSESLVLWTTAFKDIVEVVNSIIEGENIDQVFSNIFTFLENLVTGMIGGTVTIAGAIGDKLGITGAVDQVITKFSDFVTYLEGLWDQVRQPIENVINGIGDLFFGSGEGGVPNDVFSQVGEGDGGGLFPMMKKPFQYFIRFLHGIGLLITAPLRAAIGLVRGLFSGEANDAESVLGILRKPFDDFVAFIESFWDDLLSEPFNGLINSIEGAFGPVIRVIDTILGGIAAATNFITGGGGEAGNQGAYPPLTFEQMTGVGSTGATVGGYAEGGQVYAGQPYLVGEQGPELFMPGASGEIIPNHQMGGLNITINVQGKGFNEQTLAAELERRLFRYMDRRQ